MTDASRNGRVPRRTESLFDRYPWLYAFCRDHLFRDDTERMAASLWTAGVPPAGSRLLELGCGPGFYARRLAATFEHLSVTGVDRSEHQLERARALAAADSLDNCSFAKGDARRLAAPDASFDAVIASRLFVILPEPERVISEAHRVLKPGGRFFVAEPRSALRAAVPLGAMRLLAGLEAIFADRTRDYREPNGVRVMTADEFDELVGSRPWTVVRRWHDLWYQYAVCEKKAASRPVSRE